MIINLNPDNRLSDRQINYLGGQFNWVEKLKLGGVGSTKFAYLEGPEDLSIVKNRSQDICFTSFELYKRGLVLRFNTRNVHKGCLIRFIDLKSIKVISQRLLIRYRNRDVIVKTADISLKSNDYNFKLGLTPTNYKAGVRFLTKKPLKPFINQQLRPEILKDNDFSGWLVSLSDIV